ncbi:MAG: hemerythrin family protein [SAR324 cluster bacterium]|nr:hemerythrin family protein [SAR324 cluster bacterium]
MNKQKSLPIQWSPSLATEIFMIDDQHKELFRRIDRLMDALTEGISNEELLELFSFLEVYTLLHFNAEEEYMTEYNYPMTELHKTQHVYFVDKLEELKEQAKNSFNSHQLADLLKTHLIDWLINHIVKMDQHLAAYLKKNRVS